MAKRYKDIRDSHMDDWEDFRREDRQRERQKGKRRRNNRKGKHDERFRNFKDFSGDY